MAPVRVRTVPTLVILFAVRKNGQPVLSHAQLPEWVKDSKWFDNSCEGAAFRKLVESGRVNGLPGNFELQQMDPLDGYMPDKCGPSFVLVVSLGDADDVRQYDVSETIGKLVRYISDRPQLPRFVQLLPTFSEELNNELEQHWTEVLTAHPLSSGHLQPLVRWPDSSGTSEEAA